MLQKPIRLLLTLCFSIISCNPTQLPDVSNNEILFQNHHGIDIICKLYRPNLEGNLPTLIYAHSGKLDADNMEKFICKIAQQGFNVLNLNFYNDENTSYEDHQTILAAVDYLHSQTFIDSKKIAIMGVNEAATAAILATAKDTTLVGVISLCSPAKWQGKESEVLVKKITPRPMLIIASDQDQHASTASNQLLYDMAGEPKKLVWLAIAPNETDILSTDLEPVVRQVTLLFLRQYLSS